MNFRKALLSFLSITFLLVLSWVFFLFTEAILENNTNDNIKHVPANATFALRLDAREIAEKSLFSVFLDAKDEEILALIQASFSQARGKGGQIKNYGIDYLSDIVVFEIPYKGTFIYGLLVNVTNENLFRKNSNSLVNISACKDNVGVILRNSTSSKQILKSELKQLATKIVSSDHTDKQIGFAANRGSGKFIETSSKGMLFGKEHFFGQTNILFELQETELLLSGKIALNSKRSINAYNKRIRPKGMHISTSIIPQQLNDSLKKWASKLTIKTPNINQVSINFMGTKVINHSSGFFVIPQIELYVECENPFDIGQFIKTSELIDYFDYKIDNGSILFQDEKLYFKQISQNSFYIGITKDPILQNNSSNELFSTYGELKPLVRIEGGGLMTAFLEMMPIYRASKNLTDHTKSLELKIIKKTDKSAKIEGNLKFSNGYYPMNELIKFLLVSQLMN